MPSYVQAPDIESAPMLDETILYSPGAKQFCVLNSTASYIWDQLAEPATVERLSSDLREEFAIEETADVESDVQSTLERFEALQVVCQV